MNKTAKNMQAVGIGFILMLFGLGLLGFGYFAQKNEDKVDSSPVVTVTATATPTEAETTEPAEETEPETADEEFDRRFTKMFEDEFGMEPTSDILESHREMAQNVCKALDTGLSAEQIVMIMLKSANGDKDVEKSLTFGISVGVKAYCPEHVKKFTK